MKITRKDTEPVEFFPPIFEGCQVVLELSSSVTIKQKKAIKDLVVKRSGVISYIVTKKSTHVVLDQAEKLDTSFKVKQARKYDIPILSLEFLQKSAAEGQLLDTKDFLLEKGVNSQQFDKGKIAVAKEKQHKKKAAVVSLAQVPVYHHGDNKEPSFPEDYQLAKALVLKKDDKKRDDRYYAVLEVHAAGGKKAENDFSFRVMLTAGWEKELLWGRIDKQESRYLKNADEALSTYAQWHDKLVGSAHQMARTRLPPNLTMGSEKFHQLRHESVSSVEELGEDVAVLVESLWQEAMGEVEETITIPVSHIKHDQVDKAEGSLLKILKALEKGLDEDEVQSLSEEFFDHIHYNKQKRKTILSKKDLINFQNLCQLLHDIVSVGESTNWLPSSSPLAKYRALRCNIHNLLPESQDFQTVKDMIFQSKNQLRGHHFNIENIYKVQRPADDANFQNDLGNQHLLFHASPVSNFVGILSRGLLLPSVVGHKMLGHGIYFADTASTSIKYSVPGTVRGTRLMLVNNVALGKTFHTTKTDQDRKSPPKGYQSVHGVKSTHNEPSDFEVTQINFLV